MSLALNAITSTVKLFEIAVLICTIIVLNDIQTQLSKLNVNESLFKFVKYGHWIIAAIIVLSVVLVVIVVSYTVVKDYKSKRDNHMDIPIVIRNFLSNSRNKNKTKTMSNEQ